MGRGGDLVSCGTRELGGIGGGALVAGLLGRRSAVGRRLSSTLLLSRGIRNAKGTASSQPNPCLWRG